MKAYELDLREKVLATVAAGKHSKCKLAEAFGISASAIKKWARGQRESGRVAPSPHAGGTAQVLAAHPGFLQAAAKAQSDISLEELCQ